MPRSITFLPSLLLLLFLLSASQVSSQLLRKTKVRELNSDGRPLANVSVILSGAVPKISGQEGDLLLAFDAKQVGDTFRVLQIQLEGYELVNTKVFENMVLGPEETLGEDIILAKSGVVDSAKAVYFQVSFQALEEGYHRRRSQLEKALESSQMDESRKQARLDELRTQYEKQNGQLDELAERFARVNFDDVGQNYRDALLLFKEGKIEEAKALLEAGKPFETIDAFLAERNRIDSLKKEFEQQAKNLEGAISRFLKDGDLLLKGYGLTMDLPRADSLYGGLLKLRPDSLELLFEAEQFYRTNFWLEKAERSNQQIILHPHADTSHQKTAYSHLDEIQRTNTIFESSDKVSEILPPELEGHFQLDSTSLYQISQLANLFSDSGSLQLQQGQFESAIQSFAIELLLLNGFSKSGVSGFSFEFRTIAIHLKMAFATNEIGNSPTTLQHLQKAQALCQEVSAFDQGKMDVLSHILRQWISQVENKGRIQFD